MAKTIRHGALVTSNYSGGISNTVHSNAGRLIAVLISNPETTNQTVLFYDDTSGSAGNEIAAFHISPEASPFYVRFPREAAMEFATGLYCNAGNCDVHVWSIDYG
jgi:hypothetical protein